MPKELNIQPCYQQSEFDPDLRRNKFQKIVSPNGADNSLFINQNAYFSLANIEPGATVEYTLNHPKNGVYIFVINGQVGIEGETLDRRDAIGLWDTDRININTTKTALGYRTPHELI